MKQNKLIKEDKNDEFVNSLKLTPEKIKEDMERMKSMEGFPKGDDEDLLDFSIPPYYTPYPNPYLKEFILLNKKNNSSNDDYKKEPYVGDISEGKNDVVYSVHNYHTKVPPKVIEEYIKHYTEKGDTILDFFCGSGMTGVAAMRQNRNAILIDLSPAATFITSVINNNRLDILELINHIKTINTQVKSEWDWVYKTKSDKGNINESDYYVWSDVFNCPHCKYQFAFWDHGVEQLDGKVKTRDSFECPKCSAELNVRRVERVIDKEKDIKKRKCVQVFVKEHGKTVLRDLNEYDHQVLKRIEDLEIPYWFPLDEINPDWYTSRLSQSGNKKIINISRFFSKRNLLIISAFRNAISKIESKEYRNACWFTITSLFAVISDRQGFFGGGGGMPGNFYMPIISMEKNIFDCLERKITKITKFIEDMPKNKSKVMVSCQSATDLNNILENSIDYIFIDPPFGANLMYSELNTLWEGWLKIITNNKPEAIVNDFQKKDEDDYSELMTQSFKSAYRVLKPNHWISIEFHNTQSLIWRIIQNGLVRAGFIVAQVATLDKQTSTLLQNIREGAVNNDLLINAYKPSEQFTLNFLKKAGLNLERDFIKIHIEKLPVEPNIERTQQMLYSKLLAQYIQNGFEVRMDASEFYGLLKNNFIERDGFWFNKEQIPEYEKRVKLKKSIGKFDLNQTVLGIDSEKTAIIWLAQFLRQPKTFSEIQPEYLKAKLEENDKIPELKSMLEENFTTENGKYRLPSVTEKREKEDMRDKRLDKEFQEIIQQAQAGKKITEVRKEALLHGLMKLYNKRNVDLIKMVGNKIDKKIIESDDEIYAIIDWASSKEDKQ